MATDLLEQLAKAEIPPVPETLDRQVHQRLNDTLLVLHVLDFMVRAVPYALLHFSRAVVGLVGYSLTSKFELPRDSRES